MNNQQSETAFQQIFDPNTLATKQQESQQKLLVCYSSENEDLINDSNQINEGQGKKPSLTQFLNEFEQSMKCFDAAYKQSKA